MSKKSTLLLDVFSCTFWSTPEDIYIGPLSSLPRCTRKAKILMCSLAPNFVNAGLWKVHGVSCIHSSHGAICHMEVSICRWAWIKKPLLATTPAVPWPIAFSNSSAGFCWLTQACGFYPTKEWINLPCWAQSMTRAKAQDHKKNKSEGVTLRIYTVISPKAEQQWAGAGRTGNEEKHEQHVRIYRFPGFLEISSDPECREDLTWLLDNGSRTQMHFKVELAVTLARITVFPDTWLKVLPLLQLQTLLPKRKKSIRWAHCFPPWIYLTWGHPLHQTCFKSSVLRNKKRGKKQPLSFGLKLLFLAFGKTIPQTDSQ